MENIVVALTRRGATFLEVAFASPSALLLTDALTRPLTSSYLLEEGKMQRTEGRESLWTNSFISYWLNQLYREGRGPPRMS